MKRCRNRASRRAQRGASLVEYVMGVGFVVVVAIGGMSYFGERVNDSVTNSGDEIEAASDDTPSCESAVAAGDPVGVIVPASGTAYGVSLAEGSPSPCDTGDLALPPHELVLASCPEAGPGDDFMIMIVGADELLVYGSAATASWSPCSTPEGGTEI